MQIIKRNGSIEFLKAEKFNRVVEWGTNGIPGVSASAIAMAALPFVRDGMTTLELHSTLTKTAADMITANTPNYSKVAARLNMFKIRKDAFGQNSYPDFSSHVKNLVESEVYDNEIVEKFSAEEITEFGEFIKPERDELFEYAATVQLRGKYLCQNRVSKRLHEAPQQAFMLIAMCAFQEWPLETRSMMVKGFYDTISTLKITLPTPVMCGLRTRVRQFSSCVLIECGDSIKSINATTCAITDYVSQRAGIGLNFGAIRGSGAKIRGGEASHCGAVPFVKLFQSAVKCCSQGGVRGGAATSFFPVWHYEMQSLIQLKNNRGTDENRAQHIDYAVQLCGLFYRRRRDKLPITLFSPDEVPGLLEAFHADQNEFERLYVQFERDESVRKIVVSSEELFLTIMSERLSTGRIYIANVDHMNDHSSFIPELAPVRQSNLCMEITLPTKPMAFPYDPDGEIALCTLSAFNLGVIDSLDDLAETAFFVVAALDNILDYQNYPTVSAERPSKARRSLGVGVTNLAFWLAKNGVRYSGTEGNELVHRTFEAVQFHLLNASCRLAEIKGPCEWFNQTKYSRGELPIDHYRKQLDKPQYHAKHDLLLDWEGLRSRIARSGLRNSTLSAQMPCETSSQVANSTNGIEPPRSADSVKSSKDGTPNMIVPEWERLRGEYEFLWNMHGMRGYLIKCGIIQKFFDQSISVNTNYDPSVWPESKLPMDLVMGDLFTAYDLGLKSLYYNNNRDHSGTREEDEGCSGGACKL